jgi:phage/plasmid-associated DNA primase
MKRMLNKKKEMKNVKYLIKKIKGKLSFINGILEWIGDTLYNNNFLKDLDETPYLLGFEDGVYNFDECTFYEVCPKSYYVSKSNGLLYKTKRNETIKNKIDESFSKVYPNKNIRDYVLRQLAQSLTGNKNQDIVYTHSGRGSNGKSTLMILLKYALGEYYLEISPK